LSGETTRGDRGLSGKEAQEFTLVSGKVLALLRDGLAARWRETGQAAGGGINAGRQSRFNHFSPGCAVIVSHPAGEFQQAAVEERFGIQDILNLFELSDVDPLRQIHKIAGSDAGPEGDDDALARGGEIPEVRRDCIGQSLVNG
jgi:hypothetical protein